jgi:hypothetical protein
MAEALQLANNFYTSLDGGLASGAGTMVLTTVTGLPTPSVDEPIAITIWDSTTYGLDPSADSNHEIVWVTAIDVPSRTCTILRGQESTGDNTHTTGDEVRALITAGSASVVKGWLDTYLDQDVRTTASPTFAGADLDGAVVINESGADVNTRVESDGNANMLVVDGGANSVLIGTPTDLGATLGLVTHGAGDIGLVIKSSPSQSGDLLQLQSSGGGALFSVDPDGFLFFDNTSLSMASDISAINMDIEKTAGASDNTHTLDGVQMAIEMNQAGATIGRLMGVDIKARVTAGTVDGQSDLSVRAGNFLTDLNGGTVEGDAFGVHAQIDQEAGNTITGDAFGIKIQADFDGTLSGTGYMLYLQEATGLDFGIYQSGTAPHRLGGQLSVGATAPSGNYEIGAINTGILCIKEGATPTADTNYGKLYCKSDNKVYFQDGAGVEHEIAFV